jgi:hypothetical protein
MAQATGGANRRSPRIFVRCSVDVVAGSQGANNFGPAATVDFSNFGARVQTRVALVPGDRVNLIWHGATPRSFPSQVRWSSPARSEQWHEAGLQFLNPLPVTAEP